MLNRRLIRIKVFKVLFGRISTGTMSVPAAQEEFLNSCAATRDLYYFLLRSSLALRDIARERIEAGLKKFYPTEEDLNPNRRFADIEFFDILEQDRDFMKFCDKHNFVWGLDERPVARSIYNSMKQSDYYKAFMDSSETGRGVEAAFLKKLFSNEYEDNEKLADMLEDMNPYWIDDTGYVLIQIVKMLGEYASTGKVSFPSVFVDEEVLKDGEDYEFSETDKEFALRLLDGCLIHYSDLVKEISAVAENWDNDRLVFTDMLLIVMGAVEAMLFPSIPVKVTINEYVEISKYYSTKNSRIFVNGILDKLLKRMVADGRVVKKGRGLIE